MVNLAVEENVMEQISLNLEEYRVKKVDASKDIIVHILEFVNYVTPVILIAQNVLITKMKDSNALNAKAMNIL
jgi:hypothetical protein